MTSLVYPLYHGKSIFSILENTNMLEGDVIRMLRQILDRFGQVKSATMDERLKTMISSCQNLIEGCLKDVGTD